MPEDSSSPNDPAYFKNPCVAYGCVGVAGGDGGAGGVGTVVGGAGGASGGGAGKGVSGFSLRIQGGPLPSIIGFQPGS